MPDLTSKIDRAETTVEMTAAVAIAEEEAEAATALVVVATGEATGEELVASAADLATARHRTPFQKWAV